MDKYSTILENIIAPQPQILVGYQRISFDPLSVDKEIDLDSSLACPAVSEQDSLMTIRNHPLVEKSVDLAPMDNRMIT